MKILTGLIIVVAVLVGGFYALNTYIYNEKQDDSEVTAIDRYFQEHLIERGVADIGQPIEGFDPNLLILAYPTLIFEDFQGVEALEGRYQIEGDALIFVRSQEMPMSSAERMVTEAGYATLLKNVSSRIGMSVTSEADVDALIARIDTGEHVTIAFGETGGALDVLITPLEILEDSRCPVDVTCIQAGTVRIRATLASGLGTANQTFELNQPITTEAEMITLVQVDPTPYSEETRETGNYSFRFEIRKR